MVDGLRVIQKDYEEYLEALQKEKKETRKFISRIDSLAKKNAELGIEVNAEELKFEKTLALEKLDNDIVKTKKVIHRLGKCINIMLENEEDDEPANEDIIE